MYGLGLSAPNTDDPAYFTCDVSEAESVGQVVRAIAPDAVFHLAAVTPVTALSADQYYRVNVLETLNLLEATRQFAPAASFLLATSSAMYGRTVTPDGVIHEATPLLPVNAYGVSKAAQHLMGYQYADQYKLRVIRVCPFNLVGHGLPRGLVASDFAFQLAAIEAGGQEPIISVGHLSAGRDFLDVRDAVRAYRLLIEVGKPGDHYKLASGRAVRISDLLDILIEQSGLIVEVRERSGAAAVANPIPIQIGSNTRLCAAIDWSPEIPIEQSLSEVLISCRARIRKSGGVVETRTNCS